MENTLKVLFIDAQTGYYRMRRYQVGEFFGPIDLGFHLAANHGTLNIGTGLLAGSILPGSNRLFFVGYSACWHNIFVSSMGGAGLVFDNLGINMLAIRGRAPSPSILALNRSHGEEVEVELIPVNLESVWRQGRGGTFALLQHALDRCGGRYEKDPRVLAVGPAAAETDMGAIASAPCRDGKLTLVDTWAGRGGLGSRLLQEYGIASLVYGGTVVDEDFRDRKVADEWFQKRYQMTLTAKDLAATAKYRFKDDVKTGGTFGVNFSALKGRMLSFNYRSIYMDEGERVELHRKLVLDHYLKQFNEVTIAGKQQATCGEPCVAVCKKMNKEFKKDYEPYQTMGPLSGIFDQAAAEKLNERAAVYGFDAISGGCVVSWLMECLAEGWLKPAELGVSRTPCFSPKGFRVEADSMLNAELGVELLDSIIQRRGLLDLSRGARKFARAMSRTKDKRILDSFVYNANARNGWMTPNQYWVPGALAPMAMMGKYYFFYDGDFLPPRRLGAKCAERMHGELLIDNMGMCRFHRGWAEEMLPEIIGSLYGKKEEYLRRVAMTATRIHSRNAAVFWESERNVDFVATALQRLRDVEGVKDAELSRWIDLFQKDRREAALSYWYEMRRGADEALREF
ncbi:MAG: aldehyde ferredoxin oxidoreductase [Elusimicrobia bacterium GWA2_69_24]|nr:MAG: aldehyde ferredoxin oxidoreductase [Elusimicrobia bacterium GWA2_69_24]HBL18547.1 aldehyde ferredoxin oxidoreductase [Elusimicrobiota bacterium]